MRSFFYPLKRPLFLFLSFILTASVSSGQGWQPGKKIVAGDRASLGTFGNAISISGNYAVVGAFNDDGAGDGKPVVPYSGSAYLFFNDNGTWKQIKKIYQPVREIGSYFGRSVCIKDDYMIIGSESETDANGQNRIEGAGAAYVYAKDQGGTDNWGLVKKMVSPNREYREYFGSSVAIEGDYAVAGAYYVSRAYMFEKNSGGVNNWGVVARLLSQGTNFDTFGGQVAISGGYVVIGARSDDNGGLQHSGAAYIFKQYPVGINGGWNLVKRITAPVIRANETFGSAIAIDGDHVVIAASGAAYIFSKNNGGADQWGLEKKLTTGTSNPSWFGASVAIKGGSVVVGAPGEQLDYQGENPVSNTGAAWVFNENRGGAGNWGQTAKIHAPDRDEDEYLGGSVALNETQILVGSPQEHDGGPYAMSYPGAVYSFSLESALPVKLASFSANQRERQAYLKWTTTEETNSSHFELQRSADGRAWITLENVKAVDESRIATHYEALDKSPLAGQNLYRLKMVDNDGTFAYSRIQTLFFDGQPSALFYPNPATDRLQLDSEIVRNTASLKLLDQAGKPVFKTSKPTSVIPTNHLSSGTYILQVTKKDGTVTSRPVAISH
jgi:hypothetical protein